MLIPVLLICMLFTANAIAADKKSSFALVSSSVEDGAEDVSCQPVVELTFNKNVINMSVAEQNMTCFTLLDAEENPVEIELIMADDQIEPEKKRIISVSPVAPLNPHASYTLLISEKLTAKNGNSLDEDISIAFTTGDADDENADGEKADGDKKE